MMEPNLKFFFILPVVERTSKLFDRNLQASDFVITEVIQERYLH